MELNGFAKEMKTTGDRRNVGCLREPPSRMIGCTGYRGKGQFSSLCITWNAFSTRCWAGHQDDEEQPQRTSPPFMQSCGFQTREAGEGVVTASCGQQGLLKEQAHAQPGSQDQAKTQDEGGRYGLGHLQSGAGTG